MKDEPKKIKTVRRKLISFSNYSTCITLPKQALEQLGWQKGSVIDIEVDYPNKSMTLTKKDSEISAQVSSAETTPITDSTPPPAAEQPITTDSLRW